MNDTESYEYIVVGSGAGGGTVAARLAENGCNVLVLEAGSDPVNSQGGNATNSDNTLPDDYHVPGFHAISTENEAMRWDYFVRHYEDQAKQEKDPKYVETYNNTEVKGVLYPRAGCLGGCTAHNAMITVYPHNADWDNIAELTGDDSWRSETMRGYFQKLENCHHRPFHRLLSKIGINPTRHGFDGWLQTEKAIPRNALQDKELVTAIADMAEGAFAKLGKPIKRSRWQLAGLGDPNDWRLVDEDSWGIRYPPLATKDHARTSTRERLIDVASQHPGNLKIILDALVTKVLFDEDNRATGVEYLVGKKLYKAHHQPSKTQGELRVAKASREVILAGGAFNTPQLLMLSGVGPKDVLEEHNIPIRKILPGVGRNLQDRYEVGVVNRMNFDSWYVLENATFSSSDPQYKQWKSEREGVYTTNGAVMAAIRRSFPDRTLPDLFCFALLGLFRGYFPGYSKVLAENHNYLTFAILKAHTVNNAGYVRLRSSDPTDTPYINFSYFEEGNDHREDDVNAVVEGIRFVRDVCKELFEKKLIAEEELPGSDKTSDDDLKQFVKDQAWGHHASCTCPIGKDDDDMAVLTSDFRVRGTKGLRVVDASVFPKIPGFFIVSAVYMIAEKAADVILNDRRP